MNSKDNKKRKLVAKYEIDRMAHRYVMNNLSICQDDRYDAFKKLNNLPKNSCKTRIKNRCVISDRSKSIYRYFKISRIKLRELASSGMLPGVRKSS